MKIIDGAPLAAIYTRKSKATDTGESIENQIARCIALCDAKGWGYIVYVDYDYSGKDTDRPDFIDMMKKVRNNEFDYVVVYHIYRLARNMKDFTLLIDEYQALEIGFISISQDFDTTTPMGRAAMYMTAVFGQLERENMAEQVRDNMIYLAEKGRWNGGPIPYGFELEKEIIEYRGSNREVSRLIILEDEANIIEEFYDWYLERNGSIRNNVRIANSPEMNYKTKNGARWAPSQMSRILRNPIYCIADEDAYDYFKNHTEVQIVDEKEAFDGTYGLMFYNRRKPYKKTTRERPEEEWILAIGEHQGFIPGEIFTKAQLKLKRNKDRAPRIGQSIRSPLAGLVRCGRCESAMSVFSSPKNSADRSKGYFQYFRCLTREQKSVALCDNMNARADVLEDLVVSHIIGLLKNESSLKAILGATNDNIDDRRVPLTAKRDRLKSELNNIDVEISNLVDALGKNILPELVIKKKYKELESIKNEMRKEYEIVSSELNSNYVESFDLDTIKKYVENFEAAYSFLDLDEKKILLNSIVKEISINRNRVTLTLYFLPGKDIYFYQDDDSQADCSRTGMDSYWR